MNSHTSLKCKADVRYRVIDGEAVVIRQSAAEVLLINRVGARILELIDAGTTVQHLLDRLAEEFEADRTELHRDALEFIDALIQAEVLEVIPNPPPDPS